jgi:lysophospholipase L1-like esterase
MAGVLFKEDGKIDESYFLDGLHLNEKGYTLLVSLLQAQLLNK